MVFGFVERMGKRCLPRDNCGVKLGILGTTFVNETPEFINFMVRVFLLVGDAGLMLFL